MSESLNRWFGRLKPRTVQLSRNYFRGWIAWLHARSDVFKDASPDDLIRYQRGASGDSKYDLLDLLQGYVLEKRGRVSSKRRLYGCIRSFFMHNRAELPRDPAFKVSGEVPKVVGTLTIEEFKRVLVSSNRMYRAVFLSMFQGGMGIDEILWWSENGLMETRRQLQRGSPLLRVDLPGRKKNRFVKPYYTFLGFDGVEALKAWMEVRPDGDHVFVTARKTPLSYDAVYCYWTRRLKRLGLVTPRGGRGVRYGKNPHELRDLFRTRWEKSGASGSAAEFFMGHVVDPLEYNKAFRDEGYARREYRRAERWLNVVTEDPMKIDVDEVEDLRLKTAKLERQVEEMMPAFKRFMELQRRRTRVRT